MPLLRPTKAIKIADLKKQVLLLRTNNFLSHQVVLPQIAQSA